MHYIYANTYTHTHTHYTSVYTKDFFLPRLAASVLATSIRVTMCFSRGARAPEPYVPAVPGSAGLEHAAGCWKQLCRNAM